MIKHAVLLAGSLGHGHEMMARSCVGPDGGFLYVDQSKTDAVAAFAVNGGSLTPLRTSPFPLPAGTASAGIAAS